MSGPCAASEGLCALIPKFGFELGATFGIVGTVPISMGTGMPQAGVKIPPHLPSQALASLLKRTVKHCQPARSPS